MRRVPADYSGGEIKQDDGRGMGMATATVGDGSGDGTVTKCQVREEPLLGCS